MPSTKTNRAGSAVLTYPSATEIVITRVFDAPAKLLFSAWTTPEHVKRWWGFTSSEWLVCEVDLRVGGQWRWVIRESGSEVGFHGTYREIVDPTKLVATEVYEGSPVPDPDAAYTLNTTTFVEVEGVTTMSTHVDCRSAETRDAMIASGMEGGIQVSYDRMDALVQELASG